MPFQKGHKVSQETKNKISKANKGRISPLRGRILPLEVRQKIGKANSISLNLCLVWR